MHDVKPARPAGSLRAEMPKGIKKGIGISRNSGYNFSEINSEIEIPKSDGIFLPKKSAKQGPIYGEVQNIARRPNVIQHGKIISDDMIFVSEHAPREEISRLPGFEIGSRREFPIQTSREGHKLRSLTDTPLALEEGAQLFENLSPRRSRRKRIRKRILQKFSEFRFPQKFSFDTGIYAVALCSFLLILPLASGIEKAILAKNEIEATGKDALGNLALAKENLMAGDFQQASQNFADSYETLRTAGDDMSKIGGNFSEILRYVPGASKIASADYVIKAGEGAALAGEKITDSLALVSKIGNPFVGNSSVSLTDLFLNVEKEVTDANGNLKDAYAQLEKVNINDLPQDAQPTFATLKEKLPQIIQSLQGFSDNSKIVLDMLGYNGPRKFLFLFENNQEMRATGGFIGSYGILSISDGKIQKLFTDDIFNPDGQLAAKIIPPEPIQKMSAAWTMHDANWFPDFPTSAEKVSWFYEKTGGPTVDGVIALTPELVQNLLSITGPIDMPDYNVTINSDNFLETTQQQVEVNYDKQENQPKKIISDLMPKILDKVMNTKDAPQMLKTLQVFDEALREKHLLFYSKDWNTEQMISQQGWSGEVLNTPRDYLSVINTNINGFKTDGVIDETIAHHADIQGDGSIVDEVTVTRKHNGGNTPYDWWNKVNGDYMRVYVPEGSELLKASGQTREFISPPLDYGTLGFKNDPQVLAEQESTHIDDASGTRIYTENHKTVFANWVYVSPGESVELKYKYKLPFKLSFDELNHPADSFSVLYQKQSGSVGSNLESNISWADNFNTIWKYPDNIQEANNSLSLSAKLDTDKFLGVAFEKKK